MSNIFDGTCIKVYDPTKKELIAVFETLCRASNKLRLSKFTIRQKTISKKRIFCEYLNMEIALRATICGEEEQRLIKETLKNKLFM